MGYESTTNQPPILTKDLQRAPLKKQKYKNKLCEANKKYSFVSGAPGDENKSHASGRKDIFFENLRNKNRIKFIFSSRWK